MSKIRSKDTAPEKYLRIALWHAGIRYRKNYKELPGKPDIYIPKYKTAIFMHGCFWHQHHGCIDASKPKTNSAFWSEKLRKNCERDTKNRTELTEMSIQVIIVWECTVNKMQKDSEFKNKTVADIIAAVKQGENLYYEF